jgi:hypothetical protein
VGERTSISWTDHTFNPWIGCTRLSPACDHCYAASLALRYGWTAWDAPPRLTSDENWKKPRGWNRKAQVDDVRRRVFYASLADVFDNQAEDAWRARLWQLIAETPHLDWMLLTKRPQNIRNTRRRTVERVARDDGREPGAARDPLAVPARHRSRRALHQLRASARTADAADRRSARLDHRRRRIRRRGSAATARMVSQHP